MWLNLKTNFKKFSDDPESQILVEYQLLRYFHTYWSAIRFSNLHLYHEKPYFQKHRWCYIQHIPLKVMWLPGKYRNTSLAAGMNRNISWRSHDHQGKKPMQACNYTTCLHYMYPYMHLAKAGKGQSPTQVFQDRKAAVPFIMHVATSISGFLKQ